jgi:uncharacterized membrane protein YdjX (TVP38/TMEM64 family)
MTPDQQRIAQLEYQLYRLRRAMFLIPLSALAIISGFVCAVFHIDFWTRVGIGLVLTVIYLFVRYATRQARSNALQYRQALIESSPKSNKPV